MMNRHIFLLLLILVLCIWAFTTGCENDAVNDSSLPSNLDQPKSQSSTDPVPVPTDDAYERPGPTGDGRVILPNGRMISPVSERVTVKRFPLSMALHPDGNRLYVATTRTPALFVIDPVTMVVEEEVALRNHFGGMAISSDGTKLWVCGGRSEVVYEYEIAGYTPVLTRTIDAFGYPTGLKLSGDGQFMYITLAFGKRIAKIDIAAGVEVGTMNAGQYPYDLAIDETTNRAIATNWGTRSVSVFELGSGNLLADIEVGKNPEGVVIANDGRTAYVACSDSDDVYEVDLIDLETKNRIPLYEDPEIGLGAFATSLALSDDQSILYVTASGFNSVDVIDLSLSKVIGRIPTEWYPSAVMRVDDLIYILSGKGIGSGAGNVDDEIGDPLPIQGGKLLGSVEVVVNPDSNELLQYTQMVAENNTRTSRFYDADTTYDSPIPSAPGVPSSQIKHVVFIVKENKTFDQLLSDLPGVDGDPSLLIFGEHYTPNLHALSSEFAISDNYYSESHESDLGHAWATGVMANDYVEKNWIAKDWQSLTGVEPASMADSKTVFHKMVENNISFRVYGEVVGTLSDVELFAPYIDFNFGFYNMNVDDRTKAKEAIREWEAGIFPQMIFIGLPNDHGYGSDSGKPTMPYMVAQNDEALGMLIEWITKSEYWKETAIFVTQDDPQSGVDHIDAHRTPLLVVSPYAKRGHVSKVHHSMASIWLTMERILGMPQLTNYDRFTAPMYDLFKTEPNFDTDYATIPSNVPFAINPEDAPMAAYCSRQSWDVPDQVERIGEVVWAIMRPGEPYPSHLGVAPSEAEEEEAEEEEKGALYRQKMKAYIAHARTRKLFDPAHSLIPPADDATE